MGSYLQLLLFILLGLFLLWFVFTLYMRHQKKKNQRNGARLIKMGKEPEPPGGASNSGAIPPPKPYKGTASYGGTASSGGLMLCPICLFRMDEGDMVKTKAFPSMKEYDKDRLMHIHGCVYCMDGNRERLCPVCGKTLSVSDFLVARMFDRPHRRSHVHVLGCTQCRPLKTM
jgi:hypothetical protein